MIAETKVIFDEELVEKRIGKVSNQELQFAVVNLILEIKYKFKSEPSIEEMTNISVANIEFYRNNKNLLVEGYLCKKKKTLC